MTTLTLTNVSQDLASLELAGRLVYIERRAGRLRVYTLAGGLAHLVEDPPAGSDDAFDTDEVLRRVAAIRRLLDDAVMVVVFSEGDDHAAQ